MKTAEDMINGADEWIEANQEAWDYMVSQAKMCADRRRRFSIASLCEHVRWRMYAQGVDNFKVNNDYNAVFARRLIDVVPECADYITRRRSKVDACM